MSCALAGPSAPSAVRAGDEDPRQPAPRFPARAGPPGDRRRRVRRHLWADHAGGHPGGDRRRDPRRARRGSSGRDPPRREPFRRGRARQPQRPLAGLGSVLRAPRHLDRRGVDLLGARESAARRRGARAGRVPRRGGAGGPASRDPRLVRAAAMIGSLAVLLVGLGIAGASAAVGVATAAVSQLELTRWVSYKLRGAGAGARLLGNPGRMLATADTDALASADEMVVVSGVLAFADRPVKELMTPRTAIVAIPEGLLAAEAAHVCAQSGYSRYPVYRGSLDDVVGVAHAFDLLALQPDAPVPVRPALVVDRKSTRLNS